MKLTTFQATKTPPLHSPKNQHEGTILGGGAPIRFLLNVMKGTVIHISLQLSLSFESRYFPQHMNPLVYPGVWASCAVAPEFITLAPF